MAILIRLYHRLPVRCLRWSLICSWGMLLFAIYLTGCGHFFAKNRFLSALKSGQIKKGMTIEEVRSLAGEPDSSSEINLADISLKVWEYKQTGERDSQRYDAVVVGTYGIAGIAPVPATEKHVVIFSQEQVVTWDSEPILTGGTAFMVSDHHLLSNFHVVKGSEFLRIRLGKAAASVALSLADEERDVALLELVHDHPTTPLKGSTYKPNGWLKLGTASAGKQGDSVWTLGYPLTDTLGGRSVLMDGVISSLNGIDGNNDQLLISVPLQPGNSGGPLFNQSGEVIGITTSTLNPSRLYLEQKTLPQNINFAVKIEIAKALLQRAGVVLREPPAQHLISPAHQLSVKAEASNPYVVEVKGVRFQPMEYWAKPKPAAPTFQYVK